MIVKQEKAAVAGSEASQRHNRIEFAARRAGITPKNRPMEPDKPTVNRTVLSPMLAGRGLTIATNATVPNWLRCR